LISTVTLSIFNAKNFAGPLTEAVGYLGKSSCKQKKTLWIWWVSSAEQFDKLSQWPVRRAKLMHFIMGSVTRKTQRMLVTPNHRRINGVI